MRMSVINYTFQKLHLALGSEKIVIFFSLAFSATAFLCEISLIKGRIAIIFFLFLSWLGILFFFRDPARYSPQLEGLIISPADGKIIEIRYLSEDGFLNRQSIRITIYLSLLNVHVQRIPIDGVVKLIHLKQGKFLQAFRPEASIENEYIGTLINTSYGDILVKQIAGFLARRCVNYLEQNQTVSTGEKLGLIRFGSRVDIFIPDNAIILMNEGEKVIGGVTAIAKLQIT